jgi:hypothetical protein
MRGLNKLKYLNLRLFKDGILTEQHAINASIVKLRFYQQESEIMIHLANLKLKYITFVDLILI